MKKKLYIIQKEVYATSIEEALTMKGGEVFSVAEASNQPSRDKPAGFITVKQQDASGTH